MGLIRAHSIEEVKLANKGSTFFGNHRSISIER